MDKDLDHPCELLRKFFTSSADFLLPDSSRNKESTKFCGSFEYVNDKCEPRNLVSFSLDCGRLGLVLVSVRLVVVSEINSGPLM